METGKGLIGSAAMGGVPRPMPAQPGATEVAEDVTLQTVAADSGIVTEGALQLRDRLFALVRFLESGELSDAKQPGNPAPAPVMSLTAIRARLSETGMMHEQMHGALCRIEKLVYG